MKTTIHPDDIAVDNFAAAMKLKLAAARDKGRSGWEDKVMCSGEYLTQQLIVHLSRGNAGTFEDIANFAMMLHQRGEDPALLKTQIDLNGRVLALSTLNKVADKWAAELTEKTEISQAHIVAQDAEVGAKAVEDATVYMMDYLGLDPDKTSVSAVALREYAGKLRAKAGE